MHVAGLPCLGEPGHCHRCPFLTPLRSVRAISVALFSEALVLEVVRALGGPNLTSARGGASNMSAPGVEICAGPAQRSSLGCIGDKDPANHASLAPTQHTVPTKPRTFDPRSACGKRDYQTHAVAAKPPGGDEHERKRLSMRGARTCGDAADLSRPSSGRWRHSPATRPACTMCMWEVWHPTCAAPTCMAEWMMPHVNTRHHLKQCLVLGLRVMPVDDRLV